MVTAVLALAIVLILSPDSYGYLDPGSGSYVFQILAATFLGFMFSVRIFWTRIKRFLKRIFRIEKQ